jgi:hypothetical protein
MNLEQFKFSKSKALGFEEEAKFDTGNKSYVEIFTTATTWTIRKWVNGAFKYETTVQKSQPELMKRELKNISKR